MSATKKPRADSKLKNLPEERQGQIASQCATKSLEEVAGELAQDGLSISPQALGRWYSWWQMREDFAQKETLVEEFLEQTKKDNPSITEEKLFEHGQTMFALLALQEKSAKDWKRVQDVRHRRQLVELERQKFQRETAEMFLKWAADRRAQEIAAAGGLGQSEKIEKLGQLMFGEDWDSEQATQ